MKDIRQYGLPKGGNWELLPWISNPRPHFKIWASSEIIEPFFTIEHQPITLALILRIDIGFKKDVFKKAGLSGSSGDWERLIKAYIREQEYEENFFWVDLMEFDTDKDIFCVFSEYIDDLQKLAIMFRKMCDDEMYMLNLLTKC